MKVKIAAVLAAAVCTLLVTGQALFGKLLRDTDVKTETTQSTAATQTQNTVYLLKEYDGQLAVFENGSAEPAEVFSVPVSSLPEADRVLLKQGITAASRAELQRLIEDYTG